VCGVLWGEGGGEGEEGGGGGGGGREEKGKAAVDGRREC